MNIFFFPKRGSLDSRTRSWLGRGIQGEVDARGPEKKIPSDAF